MSVFRCCLQDIANAVVGLGVESEVLLEHQYSEYTLDIALPAAQLAIEADGPLHFMQKCHVAKGRTPCKLLQELLSGPRRLYSHEAYAVAYTCYIGMSHDQLLCCELAKHAILCDGSLQNPAPHLVLLVRTHECSISLFLVCTLTFLVLWVQ